MFCKTLAAFFKFNDFLTGANVRITMNFPFQLVSSAEFDVIGFGTNAIDYLIRVPEYPAFDSKIELTSYVQAAGGEAASTMVGLQRLGFRTAYIGRFGGDQAGELGMSSLRDEGVDLHHAAVVAEAQTQIAFILIDGRNGERTVIWHRDPRLGYTEVEAPIAAATRGRILHLTPHDTRACIRLARSAREIGIVVSIDVDNVFDELEHLLPFVDICIASAAFPQKLTGIADREGSMREIASRFGCTVIGITLGSEGSIFLCQGNFIETPGFQVPGGCVDTTGAGDAFRAGFLCGVLRNDTVEESARLANAVAALKCRDLGARSALPALDELETLLKRH